MGARHCDIGPCLLPYNAGASTYSDDVDGDLLRDTAVTVTAEWPPDAAARYLSHHWTTIIDPRTAAELRCT